ncbi:hypothetical protein RIR_jg25621.t1 [Rhizophagus irregularis DAOM 181602=DAOM 197198]|nr:hypothetical protein RIR_jg25621.t1 [Rhizophagus irregularis DAOM 181602=DAOM 197198]
MEKREQCKEIKFSIILFNLLDAYLVVTHEIITFICSEHSPAWNHELRGFTMLKSHKPPFLNIFIETRQKWKPTKLTRKEGSSLNEWCIVTERPLNKKIQKLTASDFTRSQHSLLFSDIQNISFLNRKGCSYGIGNRTVYERVNSKSLIIRKLILSDLFHDARKLWSFSYDMRFCIH